VRLLVAAAAVALVLLYIALLAVITASSLRRIAESPALSWDAAREAWGYALAVTTLTVILLALLAALLVLAELLRIRGEQGCTLTPPRP